MYMYVLNICSTSRGGGGSIFQNFSKYWWLLRGFFWPKKKLHRLLVINISELIISAVYTCIKKPESFSHSGFSLKVARQLPLNTPKNLNRKTHLRSVIFFETPPKFHWFFANVNARSNLAGIIWFFLRDLQRNHPTAARDVMRTTRVRSKVEKSRMHTTYQNTSMRFGFFRACAFRAKNPECYGFFWQCKRYNKKPRFFWILVFANVNGPNRFFFSQLTNLYFGFPFVRIEPTLISDSVQPLQKPSP